MFSGTLYQWGSGISHKTLENMLWKKIINCFSSKNNWFKTKNKDGINFFILFRSQKIHFHCNAVAQNDYFLFILSFVVGCSVIFLLDFPFDVQCWICDGFAVQKSAELMCTAFDQQLCTTPTQHRKQLPSLLFSHYLINSLKGNLTVISFGMNLHKVSRIQKLHK